eukprot:COSAG06_NODE_1374_length_9637_cov_3.311186_5_plen_187_part_00
MSGLAQSIIHFCTPRGLSSSPAAARIINAKSAAASSRSIARWRRGKSAACCSEKRQPFDPSSSRPPKKRPRRGLPPSASAEGAYEYEILFAGASRCPPAAGAPRRIPSYSVQKRRTKNELLFRAAEVSSRNRRPTASGWAKVRGGGVCACWGGQWRWCYWKLSVGGGSVRATNQPTSSIHIPRSRC